MECDLEIEIFAYKWFCEVFLDTERLSSKYNVTKIYKDECLAYPESYEASDCEDLFNAILFRNWLFTNSYLKEIRKQINEFQYSQTDFYCYVLRTCNRDDLFGKLTIFERVFATCAFVICLCSHCHDHGYKEVMRYGDICWAMYFNNLADEFYRQGGWNRLKMVSVSYKAPVDFVITMRYDDNILIKLCRAIKSYSRFKKIGKIDYDESISMSWVKFYTYYKNGSSDSDFDDNFEDTLGSYSEMENILKELKYFCDPSGSEILKTLNLIPATDSLQTSMAKLNISDKYANLESKETLLASESKKYITSLNVTSKSSNKLNTVRTNDLASREIDEVAQTSLKILRPNSMVKIERVLKDDRAKPENIQLKNQEQDMKTDTIENLLENISISEGKWEEDVKENPILTPQLPFTESYCNKILYDSREEHESEYIKEANKNLILNDQMSSPEKYAEKRIKSLNGVSNKQDEWEVKDTKKSKTERISPLRQNAENRSYVEAQNDAKKDQDERENNTKVTILTGKKNTKRKNGDEMLKEKMNKQDECEIIKKENEIIHATLSSQTTFPKRRVKKKLVKKRNYINQDYIRLESEIKDNGDKMNNSILTGQMPSIGKNGEEENKYRNSIHNEREDDDVRKFLRMLLLLGDKNGISYVMGTSF